jgi:hypothetical protein
MTRLAMLLLLATCVTGCYTNVRAPGVTGRVIDTTTGLPVKGACITRPAVPGGYSFSQQVYLPPGGLPAVTILSDKHGNFDLSPALHTQFAFMYHPNPYSINGAFLISAEGYATNELHGVATSRTSWRVEVGKVLLSKP